MLVRVQTRRSHMRGHLHLLQILQRVCVEEAHTGAVRNRKGCPVGGQLQAIWRGGEVDALHLGAVAAVPDTQRFILGTTDDAPVVAEENRPLYRAPVPGEHVRIRTRLLQAEDPDELLVATRHQSFAGPVERHGLDNVFVLEANHLLARDGIPNLSRKIGSTAGRQRSIRVQRYAPHGSLVTLEGAHPVTGVALAQHRVSI